MPDDFTCDMTTELTDAELGAIVRVLDAGVGLAIRLEAITAVAECRLESRHEGDCASWQASLIDDHGTAWLRWGEGRHIDWNADLWSWLANGASGELLGRGCVIGAFDERRASLPVADGGPQ